MTDREMKMEPLLVLEEDQPKIFGKDKDKGLVLNGSQLSILQLGNDRNADDVLVIGAQNITLASSSTIVDDAGNAQVAISAAHGTAAGTILVVA